MKQQYEDWLDFDSQNFTYKHNDDVHSPQQIPNNYYPVLRQQQKQILDESVQIFPSVKRKYEQRFTTKVSSSQSSSPIEDDAVSMTSKQSQLIKSQRQSIIKSQKDQLKKIEQQNKFLKQKVDDLSFRLRQTEIQLNKLKYSGNNNIANFQSMKQSLLKQISDLMSAHKGDSEQTCQVFHKLKNMTDFDGKLKVDLLNYFMSQLLENIINDSTFYMIDSILGKKGLWKASVQDKLRKIDQEFIQIIGLESIEKQKLIQKDLLETLEMPARKYKQQWQKFYKSYINLLNQGFVLENFLRHGMEKILKYIPRQNFAKITLHFEKIKLRKDIRILRQSWFKDIQEEDHSNRTDKNQGLKKMKINY